MGDPIMELLVSGTGLSGRPPEMYEALGKKAAHAYVQDGTDLSESVQKFASAHSMNAEQTRRIIEAANIEAFRLLFEKSAGYITFPVAEPEKVLKRGDTVKLASSRPAPLSNRVGTDSVIRQVFGELEQEKVAEEFVDPLAEYMSAREHIRRVEDVKSAVFNKIAALQNYVVDLVSSGSCGIPDVQRALQLAGSGEELVKIACQKATAFSDSNRSTAGTALVPNPRHPLLKKAFEVQEAVKRFTVVKSEAESSIKTAKGRLCT